MRRGNIYLADFEPVRGNEVNKVRPVIVVNNDERNVAVEKLERGVVTVIPLTSNVENVRHDQVFLPAEVTNLDQDSKAQTEQIRALAYERFLKLLGNLPEKYIMEVNEALKLHLAI